MRLGARLMRWFDGGKLASVKRSASAPKAGKPSPMSFVEGYALRNCAMASASGMPGEVFFTTSVNFAP